MKKRIFSGIQPTGAIHIGNYFGAIRNWKKLQKDYDCFFCIVNHHAITLPKEPQKLEEETYEMAATLIALGIKDVFVQSQIQEHTELCWILNTITKITDLERMTQFKDKARENKQNVNIGLFDYPVLMAADILIYKTDIVPVGEDQKQHVELAQTLARRFNRIFGQTFKIPKPLIKKEAARIMGLDNPLKKMSKSAKSSFNYISLGDSPEKIKEKIKRAVTDSGKEIRMSPKKPAISNLLNIYSLITDKKIPEIEKDFKGKNYNEFKEKLAEELIEQIIRPFQSVERSYLHRRDVLLEWLDDGKRKAERIAKGTMEDVKRKVGLFI